MGSDDDPERVGFRLISRNTSLPGSGSTVAAMRSRMILPAGTRTDSLMSRLTSMTGSTLSRPVRIRLRCGRTSSSTSAWRFSASRISAARTTQRRTTRRRRGLQDDPRRQRATACESGSRFGQDAHARGPRTRPRSGQPGVALRRVVAKLVELCRCPAQGLRRRPRADVPNRVRERVRDDAAAVAPRARKGRRRVHGGDAYRDDASAAVAPERGGGGPDVEECERKDPIGSESIDLRRLDRPQGRGRVDGCGADVVDDCLAGIVEGWFRIRPDRRDDRFHASDGPERASQPWSTESSGISRHDEAAGDDPREASEEKHAVECRLRPRPELGTRARVRLWHYDAAFQQASARLSPSRPRMKSRFISLRPS